MHITIITQAYLEPPVFCQNLGLLWPVLIFVFHIFKLWLKWDQSFLVYLCCLFISIISSLNNIVWSRKNAEGEELSQLHCCKKTRVWLITCLPFSQNLQPNWYTHSIAILANNYDCSASPLTVKFGFPWFLQSFNKPSIK